MAILRSDDLFDDTLTPPGTQVINARCLLRTQDNHRVVLVSGMPLAQYVAGDRMSEAHAMVTLIDSGWADQNDVARAFGYSVRTLRRYQERFEAGGLSALGHPNGYPQGRSPSTSLSTKLNPETQDQRLLALRDCAGTWCQRARRS